MDNIKQKVVSQGGKEAGAVELSPALFDTIVNPGLVHETVCWQLAKRRAGTHATLTRSNMKGGGKKPFKQKGTGNARAGSSISPIWVGGAVVFGPQPRDYGYRLPQRTKFKALASVLTEKRLKNELLIVDSIKVDSGKTKDMVAVLESLGIAGRSVLIVRPGLGDERETALTRAARNIPGVTLIDAAGLNCFDILRHNFLLVEQEALQLLEKRTEKKSAKDRGVIAA